MAAAAEKKHEQKIKESQYEKRKSTVLRKSRELSVLCDVKVCVVIVTPDGKLETWPENLDDVKAAFREAAASNKRPRSDGNRKRRRRNPSESEIPDCQVVMTDNNNLKKNDNISVAEEDAGGVIVTAGKKTEHHHDLSHTNYCYGNMGIPAGIGDYYYNNYSYPGNNNYENQIIPYHHKDQDSSSVVALCGSGAEYVGDPSCSNSSSSYGGGGGFENQIPQHHNNQEWNNNGYDFGAGMVNYGVTNVYDPLWVQPLQSIEDTRFGGDFQLGNYPY